jgi:hypothetical protein
MRGLLRYARPFQAWTDLADKTTSQFPTSNDCEVASALFFGVWRICDITAVGSSESRDVGAVSLPGLLQFLRLSLPAQLPVL